MAVPNISYQISHLLEKMRSPDKDYRYMATNDLMSELQKDSIKLDDDSERNVVRMLLRLLEDKNGEVQNLAVRCLGPLVGKVKDYQVEVIVDTLCSNMVGNKEQLRDISSIGLKTVINELPLTTQTLAATVCKTMVGRLSAAIAQQEDVSVQLEALDILGDLLLRFGGLLLQYHSNLLEALQPQLKSPRLAVRKRSIIALGYLVVSCDQSLYIKLINILLEELASVENGGGCAINTRTYIQAVGAVCRQAGHRFGDHVKHVVPLVLKYAHHDDNDDELREHCLQACENMVYKCGKEITPHIAEITQLCLEYICYDPNYNYEDDCNNGVDDDVEADMDCDEEDESDEEYSDDDDMSWKVRRAAAKCLEAIVATRHELLVEFYTNVSPILIGRFKEREENVKSDIFHAYIALMKQTKPSVPQTLDLASGGADMMMELEDGGSGGAAGMLLSQVPMIVKALHKQMKERSIKTRQGCFQLLSELINVLPGCLSAHIPALIPGIQFSLSDKQSPSNMNIDTLAFVQNLLQTNHPPCAFHPHAPVLVPAIIAAVSDPFYKISSEALLVLESLVKVLRPLDSKQSSSSSFDFKPYTAEIYRCCFVLLKASDIDQEVKERAISCMGQIVANLGDQLAAELPTCLPIFLDRLGNEITRLTAVKALIKISSSELRIDLGPILASSLPVLASFLRKNQRALKLSTLTLLNILVCNYVCSLDSVLVELPPLLSESDLHIAQLTMDLLSSVCRLHKDAIPMIQRTSLPAVFQLAQSPLLQGAALNAMEGFFQALVAANCPGLSQKDLLGLLVNPVMSSSGNTVHKQGRASIAKCVAALVVTQNTAEAHAVVMNLAGNLKHSSVPHQITFSLLAIGEIGRHVDLSAISGLKNAILECFNNTNEEVKSAASYALGNISLGNLEEYLPFVLKEIETQPKRQYLLLHSLKEVISAQSMSANGVKVLSPYVPAIWQQLFKHCECSEEGTRNVVAECLGKLCVNEPESLLPQLKSALNSPSALMRTTIVTAMKFTISDQPQPIDNLLRVCIGDFLKMLTDPDLNVRRVALVAFNSAAHNKPSLIRRDLLRTVLPHLYNETLKRKELVREVEMGPFKHEVDDGLDLRKAAFECMYTLLDSCVDRIDIFEFLTHVQDGLKDHYDIKMLTYLMVSRVAQLCPAAVLTKLDKLVEPLKLTVTTKVKANSVKQEYEKQDELKRSAMRAVAALMVIPGADKHPQLNEFLNQIKNTPDLANLFDSIQKDSGGSSADGVFGVGGGISGYVSGASSGGASGHLMDLS